MIHEYGAHPNPYDEADPPPLKLGRPSLLTRLRVHLGDCFTEFYGGFWNWFLEDIDWRRVDRFMRRAISFAITAAAIYTVGLVLYTIAIIVAIGYGAWPK